jgi:ribonuclease inhibitor
MKTVLLDGRLLKGKADLHNALAQQLHLPAYYGKNLDALHDFLSSADQPCRIVLCYAEKLPRELEAYMARFFRLMENLRQENPLVQFILLPGPAGNTACGRSCLTCPCLSVACPGCCIL